MLTKVLEQVKEMGGALIAPPLAKKDVKKLISSLPEDYIQWLETADGLYWGGVEFFGSQVRKKDLCCITDLATQNKLYQALSGKKDVILVGKTDEENFVYDTKKKRYEIRAEFSEEKIKSFSTFQKMLEYLLKEQIEVIQNYVAFGEEGAQTDK